MAFNDWSGGRGTHFGSAQGGRGAGRHFAGLGQPSGGAGFSTRGNPLWADRMDHDHARGPEHEAEFHRGNPSPARSRTFWEQSLENLAALSKIAEITTEN
ncbi:unnamed protein product [Calypogeia fissa]